MNDRVFVSCTTSFVHRVRQAQNRHGVHETFGQVERGSDQVEVVINGMAFTHTRVHELGVDEPAQGFLLQVA